VTATRRPLLVGALVAALIALFTSAALAVATLGGPSSGSSVMRDYRLGPYEGMMSDQGQRPYEGMMGGSVLGSMGMVWLPGNAGAARVAPVDATRARGIATTWLAAHRTGTTIGSIDAYPGYFTIDIKGNGQVSGMMSVNVSSGAVWYHTWHGAFIAMEDS
jgi:hypothetical protein